MKSSLYIGLFVLTILAAALQGTASLDIVGVSANLVLVMLIVSALFIEKGLVYVILVFLGSSFLRFSPGFGGEIFLLGLFGLIVFWLKQKMFSPSLVSSSMAILISTIVFYLIISPSFLISGFNILILEIIYNIAVGIIIFELVRLYGTKKRTTI